jgi:hypothetical protein
MDIGSDSEILQCISHIQHAYLFTVHMTVPSDPSVNIIINKTPRDLYRQNLLPIA